MMKQIIQISKKLILALRRKFAIIFNTAGVNLAILVATYTETVAFFLATFMITKKNVLLLFCFHTNAMLK